MSDLVLERLPSGNYAWLRPETPAVEDPCAGCGAELGREYWFDGGLRYCLKCHGDAGIAGRFESADTFRLRTGHLITGITTYWICETSSTFYLGWLAGVLYKSTNHGQTWRPSDLGFRSA